MTTFLETKERRAWQVLFNELDENVLPYMPAKMILAISGGPDSRALLESVARWPNRIKGQWFIVSIDHAQRPQSKKESELVVGRAQALGFKAKMVSFKKSVFANEQVLRDKRYHTLMQIAKEEHTKIIISAHHRDDNAEGYLMSLLGVGGGAHGAAMQASESLKDFLILRPFVSLSKNELLLALSLSNNNDFAIDNYDLERRGQRAFVRHEILPKLHAHAPHVSNRLNEFAKEKRMANNTYESMASALITWQDGIAIINAQQGTALPFIQVAIRMVLKKWCSKLDLRQCRSNVEKMAKSAIFNNYSDAKINPGLDRPSNWFIVKPLKVKIFHLPGVIAQVRDQEIVMRRI